MRAIFIAAIVLCAPALSAAQSAPPPTEAAVASPTDGAQAAIAAFDAIMRGDYAQAAAILNPIVDRWPIEQDEVAGFLLGALYESGLGVDQDVARACALFSRSATSSGPFGPLARQLMYAANVLGTERAADCAMLSNLGFNHGFTPTRFTLGMDHSVAIDLRSKQQEVVATVSFRGKDKDTSLRVPLDAGTIYLPFTYTPLDSRDGSAPRRHFIEAAGWIPRSEGRWELLWSLSEIVEGDVVAVATEALTTYDGDRPPHDLSLDLQDLVRVQVNEAGHAEFSVLNGPDARSEGIPTQAERQELGEQAAKRKAAEEKVNWKRRRNPGRAPSFAYADADGCGDLFLYGWSAERAESIAIRADKALLRLSAQPRVIDLAAQPVDLEVLADVYDRPQRRWRFCTDFIAHQEGERQETWRAVGGTVTIQLSEPGVRAGNPNQYRATVQIDNAEFMGPSGERVRAARPIRLTAVAGSSW